MVINLLKNKYSENKKLISFLNYQYLPAVANEEVIH